MALSTTRRPIISILQELGIGNAALFFRRFKAAFGCTPTALRRGHLSPRAASGLSEAAQREAIARLRRHAETQGAAAEQALSLPKQAAPMFLAAPHHAHWGPRPRFVAISVALVPRYAGEPPRPRLRPG